MNSLQVQGTDLVIRQETDEGLSLVESQVPLMTLNSAYTLARTDTFTMHSNTAYARAESDVDDTGYEIVDF